jgi:hypothetical protein
MSVFLGLPSRSGSGNIDNGVDDDYDSDVTYDPQQGPPPQRRAAASRKHTDASIGNSSSPDDSTDFTSRDAAKLRLVREKVTEALSAPEGEKYVFVEVSSRPNRWDNELLNSVRRFDASNETFELSDGTVVELQNVPDKGVRTVLRRPDGSQDTFGVVRFLGSGETEPIAEFIWNS